MHIFCESTRTITISKNRRIYTYMNHCLLDEKNEALPLNYKTLDSIGLLLTGYDGRGLGQSGIWGNECFDRDHLYTEWDGSLVAALTHELFRYFRVSEEVYYQKLEELPPLATQSFVYHKTLSCYKHLLHFVSGEGNFFGGYKNSEGYYLVGLPSDTIVTFLDPRYRVRREDTQTAKKIIELYLQHDEY